MVLSIGVWSLSLNSGYGVTGIVAVGLIWKFRLRRIMAEAIKKRGTPAQTRKGGRQHRQGKGDASTDKERGTPAQTRRGAKQDKEQGRGRKFFCMEFAPLVVPPDGAKPMQKTPPLCSLSCFAYPPPCLC